MLRLVFSAGSDKYAVESAYVIEVVPYVDLSPISNCPDQVQGMLNYRGEFIPILDFCKVVGGKPANHLLSTRIVILGNIPQNPKKIGIIVEKSTSIMESKDETVCSPDGISQLPFVEKVINQSGSVVNCLNPGALYRYFNS